MWNLPERKPLKRSDPTAYSFAEDLRSRAYALQEHGAYLDDVLVRVAAGNFLDAHVLRLLLAELARETALQWGRAWTPITAVRLSMLSGCPDRMTRRSVERLVKRGVVDRRVCGKSGGGSAVQFSCDPREMTELLDVATWIYLSECFPDRLRPSLDPDMLQAVKAAPKSDIVSLFRAVTHDRSSKNHDLVEKVEQENAVISQ